MILLDGKGHGEGWIFPFILLEQRLIKLIWNILKEHNVTLTPVLSPPNLGLTEIQSDRVILIIFSLSDYSVCIQLYLHFFLFDTINMQFICLAIHTDKYIYSALWLQSSVCNINCNCPISVVVGREATLNWTLGEQILMFVPIQCVTTDRSLHLHVLLPFLFAFDMLWSRDCLFPCESVKPLACFPPDASSWSCKRGLRALCWCFCCAERPRGKWEAEQVKPEVQTTMAPFSTHKFKSHWCHVKIEPFTTQQGWGSCATCTFCSVFQSLE